MQTAHATTARPSTTNRAKSTNDPRHLPGHSGRTPAGRRRRDLVAAFISALGGIDQLSEVQLMKVRKAAELTVIAEQARANALTDGGIDLEVVIRAEGTADRAVKALGMPDRLKGKSTARAASEPVAELQAYLAQKAGA